MKVGGKMRDLSYKLITKALDVSSLRQRSISSNIANINTPDYKANKVEFEGLLAQAKEGIQLKKTHEKHFGISKIEDIEPVEKKRDTTTLNDNGNNVDIDLEMAELAANELYYSALTRQISSKLSSLNYVINR